VGEQTIDFANPLAVKALNKALLAHFYAVKHWDIPDGFSARRCRAGRIIFIIWPICWRWIAGPSLKMPAFSILAPAQTASIR
jgi:hypothetical protein